MRCALDATCARRGAGSKASHAAVAALGGGATAAGRASAEAADDDDATSGVIIATARKMTPMPLLKPDASRWAQ